MITISARRLLAAIAPNTKVTSRETIMAANIRSVVRRAYPGRARGSSEMGLRATTSSGCRVWRPPTAISTRAPITRANTTASQGLAARRGSGRGRRKEKDGRCGGMAPLPGRRLAWTVAGPLTGPR